MLQNIYTRIFCKKMYKTLRKMQPKAKGECAASMFQLINLLGNFTHKGKPLHELFVLDLKKAVVLDLLYAFMSGQCALNEGTKRVDAFCAVLLGALQILPTKSLPKGPKVVKKLLPLLQRGTGEKKFRTMLYDFATRT